MPRIIDRDAHKAAVIPATVRLIAEEGLQAASYRRVADASGLSVAAIRNMWQSQSKLHRHAAISLKTRLFDRGNVARDATAEEYLVSEVLALLPKTADSIEAHRAWQVLLASAPPEGTLARLAAEHHLRTRITRVALVADGIPLLRLPPPRPGRVILAQDYAEMAPSDLSPAAQALLSVVIGLTALLIQREDPLPATTAEAWVRGRTDRLLDFIT